MLPVLTLRPVTFVFAILAWALVVPPASHADSAPATQPAAELRQQRREAAHRRRRVIFNNDGNDPWSYAGEPRTHEYFLSRRTTPLVGTQVDAIFYCTGVFNFYTHHSQESEALHKERDGRVNWGWDLGTHGPDTLATMVRYGHEHQMEVFWSMRMNDCHDSTDPRNFCQWKADHPECLVAKQGDRFPAGARRWSALNYAMPAVRDKVERILTDVGTRYEIDGLELDFFRSPVYFQAQIHAQPVTQAHCDMMTDLLRRVRAMADRESLRRGRPLLIAVRVPDSVGYAKAIGLDIVRWLDEGLIDIMSVGCLFRLNPWETSVALGHKYDVPVYPSLSESRFKDEVAKELRRTDAAYRGRALEAWAAGADGIYVFNLDDVSRPVWNELGDPQKLLTLEHVYSTGYTNTRESAAWLANGTRFLNLPVPLPEKPATLKPGAAVQVELRTGPPPAEGASAGQAPRIVAQLRFKTPPADPADVEVKLNGHALSAAGHSGLYAEYRAQPAWMQAGVNQLALTLRPDCTQPLVLQDLLLRVLPP